MALTITEKIEKLENKLTTLCDFDDHNEKQQTLETLNRFKAVQAQKIARTFNF